LGVLCPSGILVGWGRIRNRHGSHRLSKLIVVFFVMPILCKVVWRRSIEHRGGCEVGHGGIGAATVLCVGQVGRLKGLVWGKLEWAVGSLTSCDLDLIGTGGRFRAVRRKGWAKAHSARGIGPALTRGVGVDSRNTGGCGMRPAVDISILNGHVLVEASSPIG
jgi:hypothetical protein